MDNNLEKLEIIKQSINDTKFITDNYKPYKGVKKIFLKWGFIYSISMILFYVIDKLNFSLELYNINNFFNYYNAFKIIICTLIPLIIFWLIERNEMSAKERSILKVWIIFPILLALDKCLPSITSYLNAEALISFYSTMPISLIINLISLIYIYSCYHEKFILYISIIYIIYIVFAFIFLLMFDDNLSLNSYAVLIFNSINSIHIYGIIEISSIFSVALFLKGKERA